MLRGRWFKLPFISSSQRTRPSTSAAAIRDTSCSSFGWLDRAGLRRGLGKLHKYTRNPVFLKWPFFRLRYETKKLKLHFQCPQTRGWIGVVQIKLSVVFTLSFYRTFFVQDIFSGWGQSNVQQMRSFLSFAASNKEDRWWNSELNSRHFQKIWSEVRTHCLLVYYVFLLGSISLIFRVWKTFLLSKEQTLFFHSSSDTLWKISFCKFLLCMTLTCVLSNLPYFGTKRPALLFLPGSTV
jgi:hypothetical protein